MQAELEISKKVVETCKDIVFAKQKEYATVGEMDAMIRGFEIFAKISRQAFTHLLEEVRERQAREKKEGKPKDELDLGLGEFKLGES